MTPGALGGTRPVGQAAALPAPVPAPRATYRLQLHQDFGFDAARAVLPYLQRLGISHVYCSPIARARPGSRHGYDVVDPAQISMELGGSEGFFQFARAAHALGLRLLLDQVPNHMGVFGADNAWWMDVLAHGQASAYARFFDIDWQPPNPVLAGKLQEPVLGEAYGEVLARGELRLSWDAGDGRLALQYHEHRFPLDPRSHAGLLQAAADDPQLSADGRQRLQQLAQEGLRLRPRSGGAIPRPRSDRGRGWPRRVAEALRAPELAGALGRVLDAINGEAGQVRLHALHEAQAYRLAHWRMAADEVNYRRFFDVNDLAALRIEDEAVFEAVQGQALDLAAQGWVDGLRIDHPDGLLDPAGYFARLQQGWTQRLQARTDADAAPCAPPRGRALYLVAEKIVAAHEEVPRDWAVHGSTGYRFANLVNGLFVERRHAARMERIWRDFGDAMQSYDDMVRQGKGLAARQTMAAQLNRLTHALQRIALQDLRTRDYSFNTLREALAEVAVAMPVYRTYVVQRASAQDRQFIDWAVAQARRQAPRLPPALFDFLRRCLLLEWPQTVDVAPDTCRAFAMAFQQFCAPVAAKGIEDTALYRYHRLVSLNEVGGDPAVFGIGATAFHGASRDRQARWPYTMLATSTHDSKRSEDVRNRINVLSEEPAAWRLALRRWRTQTRSWRREVDGALAPSAAALVLLQQTLLGTLPAEGLSAHTLAAYRQRIQAYMLKAAREARLQTNWVAPNAAYEDALRQLIGGVLGRVDGNPVLADLQARAARIAWFGALNSLAMTVLKFTSPGVPDLYQGTELIDLSLVDPDNRRPVDFALRERCLAELEADLVALDLQDRLAALAMSPTDGRLKLWLAWRLLALRQSEPELFQRGRYTVLRVQGPRRRHVVAFARQTKAATLLVVVGRKFAGLGAAPGTMPVGAAAWQGTQVRWPEGLGTQQRRGFDVLSHQESTVGPGPLPLERLFVHVPAAVVLVRTPGPEAATITATLSR